MMLGFAFNKTFGKKKREQMFLGLGIIVKKFQYLLKPPLTLSPCSSRLSPQELPALPEPDTLNAGSWQPTSRTASS